MIEARPLLEKLSKIPQLGLTCVLNTCKSIMNKNIS